jgi:hypothetical protein
MFTDISINLFRVFYFTLLTLNPCSDKITTYITLQLYSGITTMDLDWENWGGGGPRL